LRQNIARLTMQSIDGKVIDKIKNATREKFAFLTEDFLSFGSAKVVAKALELVVEVIKNSIYNSDRMILRDQIIIAGCKKT